MTPSINAALLLASHADTLVEGFEGDILHAYPDGNGVWTNGFGNTHGVTKDTPPITQAQAIADLKRNLLSADNDILSLVTVSLNQNMYDALVSFDYNIGPGHLRQSTTLRKLNAGDYYGAADAMLMWDEVAGKVSPGLLRRREAEKALFLS
jgi:lysozyme